MATVYSDRGYGVRAPVVFYNRSNEAAAQLKPGDFDWNAIFGGGVRWFHSGGIFASLSETTGGADHRGDAGGQAARRGRVVRPELSREALERVGRRQARASRCSDGSSSTSTCSSATRRICRRASASADPEVAAKSKLDPSAFFGMIERVVERYPQMKVVATTLREVHSTNRHSWGAVAWIDGRRIRRPDLRARRLRSRRRRRRLRLRALLRAAHGREPRRRPSGSAGRTARCRPRSPATRRWRRSSRCARSPRAGRRGFSGDSQLSALSFWLAVPEDELTADSGETVVIRSSDT